MKKIAQTVITAGKYYTIAGASGRVVEAVEPAENGAAVQLGNYAHKPSQEWAFIRVGEGVYRIQNRATGKMLDLTMNGTANGTWLHQWEDVNSSSQMWIVEPTNDGRVKLKAQLANTRCMDTVGMSGETGARLQIWEDVNGENQLWTLAEAVEKKPRARKAAKAEEAAEPVSEAEAPAAEAAAPAKKPRARKAAAPKAEEAAASAPAEKKPRTRKAAKKAEPDGAQGAEAPAKKPRTRKAAAKKADAE